MSNPRDGWHTVSYPEEGRVKKLGIADEGEYDHLAFERANGDVEVVTPDDDLYHRIDFDTDFEVLEVPVRELHEAVNGENYSRWHGEETLKVLADYDAATQTFQTLHFPEGLPDELVEKIGLLQENTDE